MAIVWSKIFVSHNVYFLRDLCLFQLFLFGKQTALFLKLFPQSYEQLPKNRQINK